MAKFRKEVNQAGKHNTRSRTEDQQPPSPPLSDEHSGLYQLQQHVATMQSQQDPLAYGHATYNQLQPNTTYNTPEQLQAVIESYRADPYQAALHDQQRDPREGLTYDKHGNLEYKGLDQGSVYQITPPPQPQYPVPTSYSDSNHPTPAASDPDRRRTRATRSNRTRNSNSPNKSRGTRVIRPAKSIKQKKDNAGKKRVPQLTAPLSVLTQDYDHIPIKSMDAWVNRSYETRKREVVLKKGYITRPMNSFMMYRSAYAERTKMWCTQNNHQIVSSVSGESWPMEPPEIRNLYIEYARQEREIHASTHPDYKFSPAKGEGGNRKRKESELHEDEEELSDLEDADLGNKAHKDRHGKGRPKKIKPAPQDSRDQQIYVELPSSHERSTYQYNNPGRSMPVPLGSHQLNPGQYYQTRAQPIVDQLYHPSSRVEDVTIHRTEAPVQYGLAPPLIGLPGANHDHLLDPHPWQDVNFMESQLSGYPHMNDSLINAAGGHLHIDPSLDDHISNIVQDYMPSYLPGTGSLPGEQQGLQDFGQGMNFPYSMPSEPDLAALHNEGIILDRSGAPSSHNWVEQTTLLPSYQYQYAGEGTVPYPPEASSEAWTFEDELNKDNEPQEFESRPEGNEKI